MTRMPVVAFLFAGVFAAQVAAQAGVQVPRTLPPFHPDVARATAAGVKAPTPTVRQEAKYTSAAMRAKIQGQVVLDVLVSAAGEVADVRVAESLDNDAYCVDILLQISAVQGALEQVQKLLLGRHIESCVADALRSGSKSERQQKVEELLDVFSRFGAR